jgi:YOP proteins translocation protein K (YscK)
MIVAQPDMLSAPGRTEQDRAFQLVTRFNLFPSLYWHESWQRRYERRTGPVADAVRDEPLWRRALSSAALREGGIREQFDFDFAAPPAKRIVLLDTAALDRVCRLIAALAMRDRLRRLVSRADVAAIQQRIGADVHRLAVEWADAVPPLAAAAFTISAGAGGRWPPAEQWVVLGCRVLCAALPGMTPATLSRLRFKFDCELPGEIFTPSSQGAQSSTNATLILRAAQDAAPQWSWLFAADLDCAFGTTARSAA